MKNYLSKSFISALLLCSVVSTGLQAAEAPVVVSYESSTPFVMPSYQPQESTTPNIPAPTTVARETNARGIIGALLRSIPLLNGKACHDILPILFTQHCNNKTTSTYYTATIDLDALNIDTSAISASEEKKSFNMYTPGYDDATVTEQQIEAIVSSATTAITTILTQKYMITGLNEAPLKQFFALFCKNYIRTLDLQTESSVQQAVVLASRFFSESINAYYLATEPTNVRKWFRPMVGACAVLRTLIIHQLVQDKATEEGSVEKLRENGTWRDLVIGVPLNIFGEWVNHFIFKSAAA
jgi:hypothetical protein